MYFVSTSPNKHLHHPILPPPTPTSKKQPTTCHLQFTISTLNSRLHKQTQLFNKRRQEYSKQKSQGRCYRSRSKSYQRISRMQTDPIVEEFVRREMKERRRDDIKRYKLTSEAYAGLGYRKSGSRGKDKGKNKNILGAVNERNNKDKRLKEGCNNQGILQDTIKHKSKDDLLFYNQQSEDYIQAKRQMQSMVFVSGGDYQEQHELSLYKSFHYQRKQKQTPNLLRQICKHEKNQKPKSFEFKKYAQIPLPYRQMDQNYSRASPMSSKQSSVSFKNKIFLPQPINNHTIGHNPEEETLFYSCASILDLINQ